MKQKRIITRKTIIQIVEDYLRDKKSLADLEQFATKILFIDEEIGEPCEFDPRENNLVRASVWFLHETKNPWNSHIEKLDFKIFRQILIEVNDKELAENLLSLLRYRVEIEKILDLYLSEKSNLQQIDKMLSEWNNSEASILFKNLLSKYKNDHRTLKEIQDGFKDGDIAQIAILLESTIR